MKELAEEDKKLLRRHLLRSGEGGMSNEYPSPPLSPRYALADSWTHIYYLMTTFKILVGYFLRVYGTILIRPGLGER